MSHPHLQARQRAAQPTPSARHDEIAAALRKAMKGLGTDEKALLSLLAATSNEELQLVRQSFHRQFNRDLYDDVKSETSGNFAKVVKGLVLSHAEYDAHLVHDAVAGLGTDEDLLSEVLCTRSGPELAAASAAFRVMYGTDMLKDVRDDVSGDYRTLLTNLCANPRDKMPPSSQIQSDLNLLYNAGEGRLGTDEETFMRVFYLYPKPYVETLAVEYAKKYNKTMDQVLKSEFSGHLKKALLILAQPYVEYYADKLYHAMKGLGTNDAQLIRIMVALKGRGLKEVAMFFAFKYKDTLYKFIEGDTSGDYKKALLSLVDHWGK